MDSLVTTEWLADHRGRPDLRILDCTVIFERRDGELEVRSGRDAWLAGHIPGSGFVDLLTEISDEGSAHRFMMPPREKFIVAMDVHGVGDGTRVVLYDRDRNVWAARVWWMLRDYGFENAAVLDGGWAKWTIEGRETSTDPAPDHDAAGFVDRGGAALLVGKEVVLDALESAGTCIVNALSPAQHNGENDDYERRGHIPGAVNVPASDLVDPVTHTYLTPEELVARTAAVRRAAADRVIVYCGGGISAASDAFVLARLGYREVAIYDGSMSEWAADPSLPLGY